MINPNNFSESSDMVATRDPPLDSRPKSTSYEGGNYIVEAQRRPRPHRRFAVPEFGNWNENNTAQPSTEPKKCCFPCFPFRQQGTRHLASHSAGAVANNITFTPPSLKVFTDAELQAATNNFDSSRELGEGGFGTVYRGVLLDGRVVAVRRLYENNFKRVEQFRNEVEIVMRLRHQNLVTLYGWTYNQSRELLLVYEYIPNGTVADHLHGERAKFGLLSWPVRLSIAVETAYVLSYLHQSDTIHRDVKTNNILLDNDFRVKVADLGLSRLFPNDVTQLPNAPQGNPGYVDPEYYQCYQLTERSDVYSFGVVLIELISSLKALDFKRQLDDIILSNMAINKIQNGTLQELVDENLGFETDSNVRRMVTMVAELAFQCLHQERGMRPTMKQVLWTLKQIQD